MPPLEMYRVCDLSITVGRLPCMYIDIFDRLTRITALLARGLAPKYRLCLQHRPFELPLSLWCVRSTFITRNFL